MNRALLKILFIFIVLFAALFTVKWYGLQAYHIYPGKVTGFTAAKRLEPYVSKKGSSTSRMILRTTPDIEYYRDTDTIRYGDGKRTLLIYFTFDDSYLFSKGETIKVLEDKSDEDSVMPFTFLHYWLYDHELILVCLIAFIIWGFDHAYLNKKP